MFNSWGKLVESLSINIGQLFSGVVISPAFPRLPGDCTQVCAQTIGTILYLLKNSLCPLSTPLTTKTKIINFNYLLSGACV